MEIRFLLWDISSNNIQRINTRYEEKSVSKGGGYSKTLQVQPLKVGQSYRSQGPSTQATVRI